MSEENVDRVERARELVEIWNSRELERYREPCRWIVRGAGSGIDLLAAFSLVFEVDNQGPVRRTDAFFDETEARRYAVSAAGPSE